MQPNNKLPQSNNQTHTLNGNEKDIRQRLFEALRRFGYKQVDVSKETSLLTRHSSLDTLTLAPRKNKRPSSSNRRNDRTMASKYLFKQTPFHEIIFKSVLSNKR